MKKREEQLVVYFKSPGQDWEYRVVMNSIAALQSITGGYIEAIECMPGVTAIVDEEGMLKGLPANMRLPGAGILRGNIVLVGTAGTEFVSFPVSKTEAARRLFLEVK